MTHAFLRGIDFPPMDLDSQFRFCNPLISFEENDTAPIYFVRDLNWSIGWSGSTRTLTPIESSEVESVATLIGNAMIRVRPGEGVVLMGDGLNSLIRTLEIDAGCTQILEFTEHAKLRCWLAVANVGTYHEFVNFVSEQAASIFDNELPLTVDNMLSARGEKAISLLRKCSFSRPTLLAIRQLAAARVSRQAERYRRLLIRYSRELSEPEGDLHQRVARHIEIVGTTIFGQREREIRRTFSLFSERNISSNFLQVNQSKYLEFVMSEMVKSFTIKIEKELEKQSVEFFRAWTTEVHRAVASSYSALNTEEPNLQAIGQPEARASSEPFDSDSVSSLVILPRDSFSGNREKMTIPLSAEVSARTSQVSLDRNEKYLIPLYSNRKFKGNFLH